MTQNEQEAQKMILSEINKSLDLLQKHLHKYCNEVSLQYNGVKATSVPLIYIDQSIKIFKDNMQKGLDDANKREETPMAETKPGSEQ